jgi:Secretion system C-terminal sorting domain
MRQLLITLFTLHTCTTLITAQPTQLTIHFDSIQGSIPPQLFSLNIWDGVDAAVASDPVYQQRIADLQLPLVRYHNAETVDENSPRCWIDYQTQTWRAEYIRTALSALDGKVGDRCISIFNFPRWLCPDPDNIKYMPSTNAEAFGQWCAALVQITNSQPKTYVKYWEIFNELEDEYFGNMDELVAIYNTVVPMMKAVDPNILVGGMSITQPWWTIDDPVNQQTQFLAGAKPNLDFVTFHNYGYGDDMNIPHPQIYDWGSIGEVSGYWMRQFMTDAELDPNTPLFLGEYNIAYAWWLDLEPGKMRSHVGAVFDALIAYYAIRGGHVQSLQAFNDRDGVYGKLSGTLNETVNEPRPAYHILKFNNQLLQGNWYPVSSNDPDILAIAASQDNNMAWMIVNRSLTDRNIQLAFTGYQPAGALYQQYFIKDTLLTTTQVVGTSDYEFSLPAESVVYFGNKNLSSSQNLNSEQAVAIKIYPNPASEQFEIQGDLLWEQAVLNDIYGRPVRYCSQGKTMNLSGVPSGIYFLNLYAAKCPNMQKVIIVVGQ